MRPIDSLDVLPGNGLMCQLKIVDQRQVVDRLGRVNRLPKIAEQGFVVIGRGVDSRVFIDEVLVFEQTALEPPAGQQRPFGEDQGGRLVGVALLGRLGQGIAVEDIAADNMPGGVHHLGPGFALKSCLIDALKDIHETVTAGLDVVGQ